MTAELEAAIDAHPTRPKAYSVYADWLQERGDPRGELIALQLAGERDRAVRAEAEAFLERHADRFAAPFRVDAFFWRFGYIHKAFVSRTGSVRHDRFATLLAHPSARFLVKLELAHSIRPTAESIATLAAHLRPALRELSLGAMIDVALPSHVVFGDLAALWPAVPALDMLEIYGADYSVGEIALPRLRRLKLRGANFTAGVPALPRLRELVLGSDTLSIDMIANLAAAPWPELVNLSASGSWTLPRRAGVDAVQRLLHVMPALRSLSLTGQDMFDPVAIASLVTSPAVRQLRSLALIRCNLDDDAAALLVRHGDAFGSLQTLDVSRNRLTEKGIRTLGKLAPEVRAAGQDLRDDDLYDY